MLHYFVIVLCVFVLHVLIHRVVWFQGRIYYEEIGDYPGQSFFDVNDLTGQVSVQQDLRNDGIRLGTYTVCLTLLFDLIFVILWKYCL